MFALYRLQNTCLLCSWLLLTGSDSSFLLYCVMCDTSAVFQPKMLVTSRISAVFFTYRNNLIKPNMSRNLFPVTQNVNKNRLGLYCIKPRWWQGRIQQLRKGRPVPPLSPFPSLFLLFPSPSAPFPLEVGPVRLVTIILNILSTMFYVLEEIKMAMVSP